MQLFPGVWKECTGVVTNGATHVYKLSYQEQLHICEGQIAILWCAPAHCTFAFWNRLVVGGMPIEMYGESWFVHFQVDIIIVLYMVKTVHAMNHIHSMNHAEVVNTSLSVSSTEIHYSTVSHCYVWLSWQLVCTCLCVIIWCLYEWTIFGCKWHNYNNYIFGSKWHTYVGTCTFFSWLMDGYRCASYRWKWKSTLVCLQATDESRNSLQFFPILRCFISLWGVSRKQIQNMSDENHLHVHMQGIGLEHPSCIWGGCPLHSTSFCCCVVCRRTDTCGIQQKVPPHTWHGRLKPRLITVGTHFDILETATVECLTAAWHNSGCCIQRSHEIVFLQTKSCLFAVCQGCYHLHQFVLVLNGSSYILCPVWAIYSSCLYFELGAHILHKCIKRALITNHNLGHNKKICPSK